MLWLNIIKLNRYDNTNKSLKFFILRLMLELHFDKMAWCRPGLHDEVASWQASL